MHQAERKNDLAQPSPKEKALIAFYSHVIGFNKRCE